jgi:hypothetical protein
MTDMTHKRRGGLYYAAVAASVLLAALAAMALLVFLYARSLTEPAPMPLPAVQVSGNEAELIQDRVRAFQQAVRQHDATPPLTLTADEINALIAANPDLKPVHQRLRIVMEGDQLKGLLSIPVRDLGLPVLKDRFLNGTATFQLAAGNGSLRLTPERVVVRGKPLPGFLMRFLRGRNLAESIEKSPRAALALERLESVQVRDGKLVIAAKAD